ncbi:hypothetical protein ACTMU2_01905 [Cupriavidus basilensis]
MQGREATDAVELVRTGTRHQLGAGGGRPRRGGARGHARQHARALWTAQAVAGTGGVEALDQGFLAAIATEHFHSDWQIARARASAALSVTGIALDGECRCPASSSWISSMSYEAQADALDKGARRS